MRGEKKRLDVKTLFVFGAGVSKSLSKVKKDNSENTTPLDKDFTKRILNTNCNAHHKWFNEARDRAVDNFLYHIPFQDMGLERAISQQISDLNFLKTIHPKRGTKLVESLNYLEDITHIICFILNKARLNKKALVDRFIEKYFDYDTADKCPNRIITFNYDTLIDAALISKFKYAEYVYFDSIYKSKESSKSKIKYKYPILLKLHGSINWKCSREEYKKLFETNPVNEPSITKTYNTSNCHFIDKIWIEKKIENPGNDVFPLIIPPIPEKPITNVAIFRYLWSYAFEYLTGCEEIVVSGYSLPETDSLATSLFSKFSNTKCNKLTIIDPSPETVLKWVSLFDRKDMKPKQIEYYTDFSSYLESV
jgi:hypothetical protein